MSGHLLYVIGQPGSGKSTLVAGLVAGLEPVGLETRPFAHTIWPGGVVELGARREKFSGTDALSMSVQPKVLAWLAEEATAFVLGEGDRLANERFLLSVLELGWTVNLVYLAVSTPIAEARRAQRAVVVGKAQSPAWVSGRVTKARRLAEQFDPLVCRVSADLSAARVLEQTVALGDPLVAALQSPP